METALISLQDKATEMIRECMTRLDVGQFTHHMIYVIKGGDMTPIGVAFQDEQDKDDMADLLKEITVDKPDAILFVMDGYRTCANTEEERKKLPPSLKDCPDALEAIIGFLYTPEATFMKEVPYGKSETTGHIFMETPWQGLKKLGGRFANPFNSSN